MRYRQLGSSPLKVSEISIGSWLTYGVGVERAQARACLQKALDLGINFIDTANVYGQGAAETVLGEILSGVPRDQYILGTKVFGAMSPTDRGLSAEQIYKQVDASLRRLGVDYIDLYQCHRYDPETPLEETLQALTRIVEQGKVRYLGFSEWSPEQIEAAAALPNVASFVSSQPQYSMLWRRPEKEVFPVCRDRGISQIVWSPLAQGVLSGKYRPGERFAPNTRAGSQSMGGFMSNWLNPDTLRAVEELKPIATRAGLTLSQFALAWVLRTPDVASAIVGASRPEQLVENVGAVGASVDRALYAEADAVLASVLRGR
jgi:aryl-alcohol dehydrogenase-like predicted oxidoreductase